VRSLVVFDLDGTLVDSRRDLADAANALIEERGGTMLPVDRITGMVGEGAALLVSRALAAAGLEPDLDSALPRFLDLYDERLVVHTRPYPGTEQMLASLPRPLAVLTNKPQRHTDRLLEALDLSKFFDFAVGGDTPCGRKPAPNGLRQLMAHVSADASQTILVGDSAIDLRTARAAGVRFCLVRYGFGFSTAQAELDGRELIADRPSDIAALLSAL
jgi:phosphoglycolate phosphatase